VVRVNFVGKKKGEKSSKILYYQKLLNLSCAIKYGIPDEAGNGIVRLLSKASNTCSRAILKPAVIYWFVSLEHAYQICLTFIFNVERLLWSETFVPNNLSEDD